MVWFMTGFVLLTIRDPWKISIGSRMQSYKLKGITICVRYGRRNQNIVFFFFCQDSYASEALLIEGNVKLFYACLVSTYFLPLEWMKQDRLSRKQRRWNKPFKVLVALRDGASNVSTAIVLLLSSWKSWQLLNLWQFWESENHNKNAGFLSELP